MKRLTVPTEKEEEKTIIKLLISLCCIFNKNHLDTNTIIQQIKSPKKSKNFAIREIKLLRKFLLLRKCVLCVI